MTWMWRLAVGVALLVCLEFALSSNSHYSQLSELEKSESVELSNQNLDLPEHREKRQIGVIVSIFSTLFNVGKFIYGEVNARSQASKQQTQHGLRGVEQLLVSKFNQIDASLAGLRNDHRWLEGAIIYADDIQMLKYNLHTLNMFSLDDAGNLQPASEVREWADGILSSSGRSIGQVLFSMHDMVTGTTHLFGNTPILTMVNNTLDPTASDYSVKLRDFATFTFNLQMAGYFAWATALNIMNRTDGINQVKQEVQQRFQEQQQSLLISLMTEWPSGRYGLPYRKRHDVCPNPPIAWRMGNMSWANLRDIDHLKFCMRADTEQLSEEYRGEGHWPAGTYCIYQQGPSCPAGFDSGSINYDLRPGTLRTSGSLPQFSSSSRSITMNYCCRSDASPQIEIRLPPIVRFSLLRSGENCQEVKHMRVNPDRWYWYKYPYVFTNTDASGSRPSITESHFVVICYYEPAFWT